MPLPIQKNKSMSFPALQQKAKKKIKAPPKKCKCGLGPKKRCAKKAPPKPRAKKVKTDDVTADPAPPTSPVAAPPDSDSDTE